MISDLMKKRIGNRLILFGMIFCVVKALGSFHILSVLQVIFNLSIPVIALYPLYLVGAIGAADVKLLSMISGFTGIILAGKVALLSLFLGAIWSLIVLITNQALIQNLRFAFQYLLDLMKGQFEAYPQQDKGRVQLEIPFSICIGISLFAFLIVERI